MFYSFALAISSMVFFFHLNWYQVLIGLLIDTLAFFIFHPIELFLFYKCFPKFKALKVLDEPDKVSGEAEQNQIFNLLCRYPEVPSSE